MKTASMCRIVVSALATFCIASAALAQSPVNKWLDEPEAAFLTNSEREQWWGLHSEAERDAFKAGYWARRDPTPGTPENEFRDVVMQRIEIADKKYTLNKRLRGALTWRGQIYVVFGPPARINVQQRGYNELPSPPPPPNVFSQPRATSADESTAEGNEIKEIWYYERTRTPKILAALNRPSLDFTFIVEPVKQIDDLQNPGLFHQLRQKIADKTVMNDIPMPKVEPSAAPLPLPAAVSATTVKKEITPEIAAALDRAGDGASALRSSMMWNGDAANATFWMVAPEATGPLTLYGRVKDSSGKTVATVVRPIEASKTYSLGQSGAVADATVALAPGEYDAAFLLQNDVNDSAVSAGTAHVVVPESSSQFAVSSLILTDRISGSGEGLTLGRAHVRPRADATFTTAESVWYLFQVANPSDPSKVTVAVRLRHGAAPPTSPTVVPAALESIGPGRYMSGFEMPLAQFAPGDYTLYVSVHDPAGREDVVRRADFRVIEAPRLQ